MNSCAETTKRKSKERKISSKVFKFTASILNEYLKFPSAQNSLYTSGNINQCLIELSLSKSYAESGLTNLSEKCNTTNKVPTGRTFRGRIQRLAEKQIREALTEANDQVLHILRRHSIFKRKAVVAIDYTRQPFYGNPDTKNVIGGKQELGTTWGYTYASIDIVEAGRRLTLYSTTINQFSEKTNVVEKLILEAKTRGIHISLVLLDRAFFTVDVISMLKRLGVYFIIPAVKNNTVKRAMLNYDEKEPVKRFILGSKRQSVTFNLYLHKRSVFQLPKKKKLAVSDLYFGFATNLSRSLAVSFRRLFQRSTGADGVLRRVIACRIMLRPKLQALTTGLGCSTRWFLCYCNVWHYANFLL